MGFPRNDGSSIVTCFSSWEVRINIYLPNFMLQRLGIGLLGFTALLLFGYVGATPTYAMSKQPGLGFIEQNRIITTFPNGSDSFEGEHQHSFYSTTTEEPDNFLLSIAVDDSGQFTANFLNSIPSGFTQIRSDIGVSLYRKDYADGQPDFVQVVDLDEGAKVKLLHGSIADLREGQGPYGGNNATFWKTSLLTAWNDFASANEHAFCISNGEFFSTNDDPTPLAFPLKKDGQILSDGYGSGYEFPGQLLILEIWNDHANIRSLSKDNLYGSSAPNILGGLTEDADHPSEYNYVGRTFAGIDDTDGDGDYETIYIFTSSYARQVDAASVLRDFGADKVIMFDGGGSTQMRCGGTSYVSSSRSIPQTIGVVAGSAVQPSCPVITGKVVLFDEINCGGSSVNATGVGLWTMAEVFNDKAESIAIPSGWSARLYLHDSESSPSKCFRSTDSDFWDNHFGDGTTVANEATWMRVFDNGDCQVPVIDEAEFVTQSEYPTVYTGQPLQIFFEVKNTGTSTWITGDYWLENIKEPMGANLTQSLGETVAPGQTFRWHINQIAPVNPGLYRSQWTINHNGTQFGPNMFIDVTVLDLPGEPFYPIQFYLDPYYWNGYEYVTQPGAHSFVDKNANYCDQISSFLIRSGWSVRVFASADFSGVNRCQNSSVKNMASEFFDDGTPLDNNVCSFILSDQPNCMGLMQNKVFLPMMKK